MQKNIWLCRPWGSSSAPLQAGFERRLKRIQAVLEPWSAKDRAVLQQLLTRLATDLASANDRDTVDYLEESRTPA